MTVNHGPIAARQHRDFESELADRCHHAVHRGIVFARISGVEDQPINMPDLDFRGRR
jgi:hypothetical protein